MWKMPVNNRYKPDVSRQQFCWFDQETTIKVAAVMVSPAKHACNLFRAPAAHAGFSNRAYLITTWKIFPFQLAFIAAHFL
jgi:hypothetical protein